MGTSLLVYRRLLPLLICATTISSASKYRFTTWYALLLLCHIQLVLLLNEEKPSVRINAMDLA